MLQFPKEFKFGGAVSGPQTEGMFDKSNLHVFEHWYQEEPTAFFGQVGPQIANEMYHLYDQDIKLLQAVGIKIYRTSIQWSRLIKNFATHEVDEQAVKFYRTYFQAIKDAGIELIVNLYHFDTPMYFQEQGGWENKATVVGFEQYANSCFMLFGDIVDKWVTMNEVVVVPEVCYLEGIWYPKVKNFKRAAQVAYYELLASALAIATFRAYFNDDPSKEIGVILNLTPSFAKDEQPENVAAAHISDLFNNQVFLDACVKGEFSQELKDCLQAMAALPEYTAEELAVIHANTVDFLGINYYRPRRVQAPDLANSQKNDLSRYYQDYVWPEAVMNKSRGWEIYPQALKVIAENIQKNYGNIKWFVAENGLGIADEEQFLDDQGQIQDDYRIDFISQHLSKLHEAIADGANCFAYCLWAPIDCWSWANAYKNRYGLISVDLTTQARTIKKSGLFFKDLSDTKVLK